MRVSVVMGAYEMARELPRTILSLSPLMQRDIAKDDYEIIVVDNGSARPFEVASGRYGGLNLRVIRIAPEDAAPSPASALNIGLREARGDLVGVMIDGARMASPGILAQALNAARMDDRTVIATLGFHLGPKVQMTSVLEGYDEAEEDRLLETSCWWRDGYRLFDISVLADSSRCGWFAPISESNALFMHAALWNELGGYDERFVSPGGGLVNLDTFARAMQLPAIKAVTLLGEATFHQVHGGVATNGHRDVTLLFEAEYLKLRGRPFRMPRYDSLYLGRLPIQARPSIARSLQGDVDGRDRR